MAIKHFQRNGLKTKYRNGETELNKINMIVIFLLSMNLTATIWFGMQDRKVHVEDIASQISQHDLPDFITKKDLSMLFDQLKTAYNSGSNRTLYNFLGSKFKSEWSFYDVEESLIKIKKFAPKIESGSYSHSKLVAGDGNVVKYDLIYDLKLPSNTSLGSTGKLTVTILVTSSKFETAGIYLNVDQS